MPALKHIRQARATRANRPSRHARHLTARSLRRRSSIGALVRPGWLAGARAGLLRTPPLLTATVMPPDFRLSGCIIALMLCL